MLINSVDRETFVQRVFPHLIPRQVDFAPLLERVSPKTFARKSHLLQAGDKWKTLFYIHQGAVRMFYTDLKGRDFNKAFFGKGQCIWPVVPSDRNDVAHFNIAALMLRANQE